MEMSELRLQMNEYLALEFSTDGTPSENVPFVLTLAHQDSDLVIFEFDEDEPFFAISSNNCLEYIPKSGMTVQALLIEYTGSGWIADREPVSDDTVVIGDPQVPPLSERRAAFASFAAKEGRAHAESWKVIECVFLRTETKYLGLVGQPGLDHAWIIGNDLAPIKVEFPQALASRRIAFGIGKALQTGKLV